GGDWHLVDKITGSSSVAGGALLPLYSSYGGDSYASGNTMVQWAPTGSYHPSSCQTYTASLTYGAASVTAPATFCPDRMDIYTGNLGGEGIEEFWHGCMLPG